MLEPGNGDVLVERVVPTIADRRTPSTIAVVVVGSIQRVEFGDDIDAAHAYACKEAQRHGTRALQKAEGGYAQILCPIVGTEF
jgi:hypothetical protein